MKLNMWKVFKLVFFEDIKSVLLSDLGNFANKTKVKFKNNF